MRLASSPCHKSAGKTYPLILSFRASVVVSSVYERSHIGDHLYIPQ